MHDWEFMTHGEGYTPERVAKLRKIWHDWHLNDMRAGTPRQMAAHGCDHKGSAYAPTRWDVGFYCYKNGLATDSETTREVASLARVPAPAPGY